MKNFNDAAMITGLGAICSSGNNLAEIWPSILQGYSKIRELAFDITGNDGGTSSVTYPVGLVEIPEGYFSSHKEKYLAKFQKLLILVIEEAIRDAKLTKNEISKAAIVVGTALGGMFDIPIYYQPMHNDWRPNDRLTGQKITLHTAATVAAERFGCMGAAFTIGTACAASTDALGYAYRLISSGQIETVIACGTESWLSQMGLSTFASIGALATSKTDQDPRSISRPFDIDRTGLVPSEGAAALVLQSYRVSKHKFSYCAITGSGSSCDAYHPFSPQPDGNVASRAVESALLDAKICKEDIVHINVHGTATKANDKAESKIISNVFGPKGLEIPVTANKSIIGHTIGASGAIEGVLLAKTISSGLIPPTINFETPDPEAKVNLVTQQGTKIAVGPCLKFSFGFGGYNSVIVFSPC